MKFAIVLFAVVSLATVVHSQTSTLNIANYILVNFNPITDTSSSFADYRITLSSSSLSCLISKGITQQKFGEFISQFGPDVFKTGIQLCNSYLGSANCDSINFTYNINTAPYSFTLKNLPTNWKSYVDASYLNQAILNSQVTQKVVQLYGMRFINAALSCFKWEGAQSSNKSKDHIKRLTKSYVVSNEKNKYINECWVSQKILIVQSLH